jgi:hypothetical protein
VTPPGHRPAAPAGWRVAAVWGFVAFVVVAAIAQLLALAAWAVGDTGASIGAFARIGWLTFGAFHHVAIRLDVPDLEVSAGASGPGATSLSVGVALLSVTCIAAWLLFRAGRDVATRCGGGTLARAVQGMKVAPSYALPAFLLAWLVRVRTPLRLGVFASGELHAALSPWQALAFPLAIAAVAGGLGGLRSGFEARTPEDSRTARAAAVAAGGWRMLVLGMCLSFAGLFVAGVVQPDGPAALLTPSTSRYLRDVFERPGPGLVLLAHHVAAFPNEAMWTLVPAMGACDEVRGSADADLLCYARFPTEVETAPLPMPGGGTVLAPLGGATFGKAPPAYLLFLLVPIVATVLGGRRAVAGSDVRLADAAVAGVGAGLVFAVLVAAASLLSTVTLRYGAAFGSGGSAGRLVAGPDVVSGALLALAWGAVGGAIGAATATWPARLATRRPELSS